MKQPLLSIVIPTRDREFYCIKVLDYMLTFIDESVEIVIQDNSSSDDIANHILNLSDKRVVYNHILRPLSFIDNYNYAVDLASGCYLCTIGDDDISLPGICEIVEYAMNNDIDSISQNQIIRYDWPSEKYPKGSLYIPQFSGKIRKIDISKSLNSYTSDGCCKNPKDYCLPTFYHGIIKRECLETIKKITGNYFGGLTPDAYSSVSLALVVKNHVIIDKPFTIAGSCPQSGTAANQNGKHCGELKDAPHFNNRGHYNWNDPVPRFYSVETIWADSSVAALKNFNRFDLSKFNVKEIFYTSYINNPRIRPIIIQEMSRNCNINVERVILTIKLFKHYIFSTINRGLRFIKNLFFNKNRPISNIFEIKDCIKYIIV